MAPSSVPPPTAPRGESSNSRINNSLLTKYFLLILLGFASLSLFLNSQFAEVISDEASIIESLLQESKVKMSPYTKGQVPKDDDDEGNTKGSAKEEGKPQKPPKMIQKKQEEQQQQQQQHQPHKGLPENPHSSRVAGLNCDAFSGPSAEEAQEMVYWEDIPSDAKWSSPFHPNHRNGPPQYLTFEPDAGGWNNIR